MKGLTTGFTTSTKPTGQGGDPNNGYQPVDPLAALRSAYRVSNARVQNYDQVFYNPYEDKTLEDLKQAAGGDNAEVERYCKQGGTIYATQFIEEVKGMRYGKLANHFRDRFNNYHRLMPHENSVFKQEFVNYLNKRLDMMDTIYMKISFWFGRCMADTIRKADGQQVRPDIIFNNLDISIINILDLEVVAWLHGSKAGKSFLHYRQPDVVRVLDLFNKKKAAASAVFSYFDENSPYEAMDFAAEAEAKSPAFVIPEYAKAGYAQRMEYEGDDIDSNTDVQALRRIPYEMSGGPLRPSDLDTPVRRNDEMAETYYGEYAESRKDLENITLRTRHLFDVKSYFQSTVLENWWIVDAGNWKYLKRVLKQSPKQRVEQTWFKGMTLFVHYDFARESDFEGWVMKTARIHQDNRDMILSDPAKLLSILETDDNAATVKIEVFDRKAFFDEQNKILGDTSDIVTKLREPVFNYRIIDGLEKTKEVINQTWLQDTLNVGAAAFMDKTERPLAILDSIQAVGKQQFISKEIKNLVINRLPYLFTDNEFNEDMSYFNIIEEIKKIFGRTKFDDDDVPVDKQIEIYVMRKLTIDFNNWLINCCGYTPDGMSGPTLSTSNIFDDLETIKGILLKTDVEVYQCLNRVGEMLTIKEQIKMFTKSEPIVSDDPIEIMQDELSVQKVRNYSVISICNEDGPKAKEKESIVLRRSTKPEFFALLDELDKSLEKKEQSIRSKDTLIYFKSSGNLFLLSKAVYDENVAILRPVGWSRTFLNPYFV